MKAFGKRPDGLRLERMKASPLWAGEAFRNLHPVLPGLRDARAQPPTLTEFLCGRERRIPQAPLPAVDPTSTWAKAPATGLRATWLGHSTVLIEIDGLRVLTDSWRRLWALCAAGHGGSSGSWPPHPAPPARRVARAVGVLALLRGRGADRTRVAAAEAPGLEPRPPAPAGPGRTFINPVCGVAVDTASPKHVEEYEGVAYYFCCDACPATFRQDRAKYAALHRAAARVPA